MKQLINYFGKQVGKKILVWITGSLGLSFFVVVGVILVAIIMIIGAIGGSVNHSSIGGNGLSACSVTGEIDEASWNAAFANAGAFTGKGDLFIELAQQNGIDPVLAAAIAFHETGRGTSNAVVNKNNPGGIMDPSTGWSRLMHFATLEEGLAYTMANLKRRIIDDGLSTIEDLGAVYAPIGAANDPNGLNAHWVPTVTKFASELGGLTMNCSPVGSQVVGNEVFKTILNEMLKYEGWPYVWGGYNPNMGFDCSGLMQWGYAKAGIKLPRTAYTQYKFAQPITRDQLQPGDLIFFKSADYAPVTHVGIYVGNGKMFNSQNAGVRYDDALTGYWGSVIVGYGRVADFSDTSK
ncbi:conjugal transfer protein [Lysinibacillus mangiferihumi]|uniref:Conjugal transfer protein n=2 Tax=Lysinibacillus TaxID=400634 RepID=A0A4U2YWX5_9BACI|nr:NlpC/P60 family protein [Lysinibacillus mangiferihumi]TKI65282.1 conjugal transfer protein [Lysinibacillus mangiferihumi]